MSQRVVSQAGANDVDIHIEQIPTPQITNNLFEESFFNGTNFTNFNYSSNDNFESLLLPTGCSPPLLFS